MVVVLISFLATIEIKVDFKNRLLALSTLGVIVPFVLFSLAKTKLGWYLMPIYPPLAIVIGCLAWRVLIDARCRTAGKVTILIAFVIAGLRAEREIQKTIKAPTQETSQSILNDFKKTDYPPNSVIYRKGPTQSFDFVSEVVCGLNPIAINNLDECLNHQGYLMAEKEKGNTQIQDFVAAKRLKIILQNDDWIIAKL
jgi:hypothetical protein